MNKTVSDNVVLHKAIAALSSNTSLHASIVDRTVDKGNTTTRTPDSVLQLSGTEEAYSVMIKRHAQNIPFGSLVDQVKRLSGPEPVLLVADYINPDMADNISTA